MIKTSFIIASIFLTLQAWAQFPINKIDTTLAVFEKEFVDLVPNNDLFLTGERLHFTAFNLADNQTASTLSKIVYVELRSDEDSIVFRTKMKLQDGIASGSCFLPTALPTGIYALLSYTNFSLNNPLTAKRIYIINPFLPPKKTIREREGASGLTLASDKHTMSPIDPISSSGFLINTDKTSYKTREEIEVNIENLALGSYSISVRKVDPIQVSNLQETLPSYTPARNNGNYYLPELRGEIISGKLTQLGSTEPIGDKTISLSIPGEAYALMITKTNDNGNFVFHVDQPYETTNAIVQVLDEDQGQLQMTAGDRSHLVRMGPNFSALVLSPTIKDWLQERSIQLQIEGAYFHKEDILPMEEDLKTSFYGSMGDEYRLDDYTRFSTVKETFVEVIKTARVRKKADQDCFEVFDPLNPYKSGRFSDLDPLLLMDGILVQRPADILNSPSHEIDRIRVFPAPYRFGPKIFRGIIDIKTKNYTYRPQIDGQHIKEFKLNGPYVNRQYLTREHSAESGSRVPDYRVQLLWAPNIALVEKKHSEVFYASDIKGSYRILIEGYASDGTHYRGTQYFEVE